MPGKKERPAGSLRTGEPAFLAVGKIRRPHGVHGDVLMQVISQHPDRLSTGKTVYLGEKRIPLTISRRKLHNDGLLLGFEGYEVPEKVGTFRNQFLYITKADATELGEDEYYHHQLIGLIVCLESGETLGQLSEIIETGANDVYVVSTEEGTEILLPATVEVIKKINLEAGKIHVALLPGLLGEENGL
jgi:16S rRNA processing protein RimM